MSDPTATSTAAATAVRGTAPPRLSLMAVGELRDALTAIQLGQGPTAIAALMAIDAESWKVIEQRLAVLGGDLRRLLDRAGHFI